MILIREDMSLPVWGPEYSAPQGWIAHPGDSSYRHRFGGASWDIEAPNLFYAGPTLIFSFDLRDPCFSSLQLNEIGELPLCSYLGSDLWNDPQLYKIDPKRRCIVALKHQDSHEPQYTHELSGPFPERRLLLEPMGEGDYPTDEAVYYQACDGFLGRGDRFIRVLGPPLWMQTDVSVDCRCGDEMKYICSIGYEGGKASPQWIENLPLFFGEGATYWFVCRRCLNVGVVTQST